MPFIPTPRGIKVAIEAVQNGIPIVNVFHVQMSSAVTPTDLINVATTVEDWVTSDLILYLHNTVTVQNIVATDVSVPNGAQEIRSMTTGNVGLNAGSAAAANAALCVSFRTGLTGRSYRGRFYLGGFPTSFQVSAHEVAAGVASDLITSFTDLIDALNLISATLVVVSKFALGIARLTAVATEVLTIVTNTKIDSQRRRTAN
jgi:hypothetical protein